MRVRDTPCRSSRCSRGAANRPQSRPFQVDYAVALADTLARADPGRSTESSRRASARAPLGSRAATRGSRSRNGARAVLSPCRSRTCRITARSERCRWRCARRRCPTLRMNTPRAPHRKPMPSERRRRLARNLVGHARAFHVRQSAVETSLCLTCLRSWWLALVAVVLETTWCFLPYVLGAFEVETRSGTF